MYRHCIFCAADLRSNREIEEFPVGRRLAFDPAKGRLWVVCRECERWNLSPLEERWEALEALERRYRDTRTRVSTDQIGLARLDEGLELVRIGAPQRPEFAAWRYGDQFGRRRRKFFTTALVGGGVVVGLGIGSTLVAGLSSAILPIHLFNLARFARGRVTSGTRIHASNNRAFDLQDIEIGFQRIRMGAEYDDGWALDLAPWLRSAAMGPAGRHSSFTVDGPDPVLTGPDAIHALSILLPRLNSAGAGPGQVRKAVGLIEDAGAPGEFFRRVEQHARAQGYGYNPLRGMPRELRLGLEMAAHEDQERMVLEGELALLEEAWKDAEALAAIADDLTLPDTVRQQLRRFRNAR